MLCDDILNDWSSETNEDAKFICEMISDAHKFILSPEFIEFGRDHFTNLTELLKVKELMKLPYPHMWLEWNDRCEENEKINCGLMLYQMDNPLSETTIFMIFIGRDSRGWIKYHGTFVPSTFREHLDGATCKILSISHEDAFMNFYSNIADVFDFVSRINSPQLTQQSHSNLNKLNRKRVSKGKNELMAHVIVNLSDKGRQALRDCNFSGTTGTRLHWRRGHFKVRKTGMFWWNPHIAGQRELGVIEKKYKA